IRLEIINNTYITNVRVRRNVYWMAKSIELQNQIYLYSLETLDFYTDEEKYIRDRYFKALRIRKRIKNKNDEGLKVKNFFYEKMEQEETLTLEEESLLEEKIHKLQIYTNQLTKINEIANGFKQQLNELLEGYTGIRTLREDSL